MRSAWERRMDQAGNVVDAVAIPGFVTAPWWYPYVPTGHTTLVGIAIVIGALRIIHWVIRIKKELRTVVVRE